MEISIHAAREGGDAGSCLPDRLTVISIHAAREGGDVQPVGQLLCFVGFQSTPPVKAATDSRAAVDAVIKISIHAAREGGDAWRYGAGHTHKYFNPRRP